MLVLYGLGIFDARLASRQNGALHSPISVTLPHSEVPHVPMWQSFVMLAVATAGVVWMSETLVHVAEEVILSVGISEFFLGIILVPLIGNVAEHLVAVQVALKTKVKFLRT